ncbi:acyltransferase [Actinotalea sp. M2MS4P-6]|uniref:acyltransferase family protein n=1 Tax=Actinotalea sp. M2MS4P-6 TaxID=2983762 RepID=UPI0021E4E142|nr:acyltransferase [Actinotalea sp. M2MS4P-6]MCV2395839.1 acyltransferase [Actinotalea sp. M2MS4P-6]
MITTPPERAVPAGATPPAASTPGRLRTLDGLRFLAAAGVVLYHFTARSPEWGVPAGERFPVLGQVAIYLSLAPELFFVISGFVILWTAWGRSVPDVVASRVARIYPAYWAALALTAALLAVWWPARVSAGQVAVNATLLQSLVGVRNVDTVYWTLWAELRFYLLVVALVAVGLTRTRVLAFAALWPPLAMLAEQRHAEPFATLLLGQYAPFFAGGMALFLVWRDGHAWRPWLVVAGNAVLGVRGVAAGRDAALTRLTVFDPSLPLLAAAVVGCFGLVALVTLTPLRRWDWSGLTAIGALTYPLYLVHEAWGRFTIDLLAPHLSSYATLLAAVAVSVLLAVVVHKFVEEPLHGPVRRAVRRVLSRPAAPATA